MWNNSSPGAALNIKLTLPAQLRPVIGGAGERLQRRIRRNYQHPAGLDNISLWSQRNVSVSLWAFSANELKRLAAQRPKLVWKVNECSMKHTENTKRKRKKKHYNHSALEAEANALTCAAQLCVFPWFIFIPGRAAAAVPHLSSDSQK